MKNVFRFLFILSCLTACSGSSSYYNKGTQLEQAGMTEEAARYYLLALQRNPNNVEAQIGMKKNGQHVLDEKLTNFYKAHATESWREAVYTYKDAEEYHTRVGRYVKLNFPPYYPQYYEEAKTQYMQQRYTEALDLMEKQRYEQAELIFKEISTIDPHYEDVQKLKKTTTIEPIYQNGLTAMEAKKYKEAYNYFKQVVDAKGSYKDALQHMEFCRNESILTVAALPFEDNTNRNADLADKIYAKILRDASNSGNEFIVWIDRKNLEKIIEEQKLGMSGLINKDQAASTGKLLGAKAVLIGKVLSYNEKREEVKEFERKGYLGVTERRYDPVRNFYFNATTYRKTKYKEFYGESNVTLVFEFSLISSETGQILVTDVITITKEDKTHYASFEGNHQSLFAGDWKSMSYESPEDRINNSIADKQSLDRLLNTRKRSMRTREELKLDAIDEAGKIAANKIREFERSR
jgi:tetratricopeptide (TPR) repeat protein